MLKKPLQKGYANNIRITNIRMNSSTFYIHWNKPHRILNRPPFLGLRLYKTVLNTNDFEKKMMSIQSYIKAYHSIICSPITQPIQIFEAIKR
ncbi:MAG: hypothetical protein EZS28_025854 [Streblomastix strix]|uniref:Uncharacterized protein n=1 Tax=Streblomastix strix TaxID=222440 RepID=A0A5J4V735_9EUKA|nr:MAG: hypothetical protein EZS28_025854 [Streblomastix strix]